MSSDDGSTSKADSIYRWLLREFQSGRIAPGERLPSENELGRLFAVSRPQVRLALARLAHEGKIVVLRGKGSFRAEAGGPVSRDIAVVLPHLEGYIYSELVVSAGAALRERGYQALFDCSDGKPEVETQILKRLAGRPLAGIIISPILSKPGGESYSVDLLRRARERGVYVVVLDNPLGEGEFSCIKIDDYQAGKRAARFLLERGHRRIGVCWWNSHAPFYERARGFLNGAGSVQVQDYGLGPEAGGEGGRSLLRSTLSGPDRPTALFCANDKVALLVRQEAQALGIGVPADLSLIGFDDSPLVRLPEVSLSSFAYPSRLMGRRAVELIVEASGSDTPVEALTLVIEPTLVDRGSVRTIL